MSRRSRRNARNQSRAQTSPTPSFRANSPENPSTSFANPDAWLLDWSNGGVPLFGPPVSEQTSMAVAAVYRCVSIISGIIAATPLKVYRDDPTKGRVEVPDHSLSDFFSRTPYPGRSLTSYGWRELWEVNELLWGNHVSAIRYNRAGRIIGFEPAWPWQTEIYRFIEGPRKGENFYVVTWPGEKQRETLFAEDVLHFAGPGFDGIRGQSRIQSFARNAVALARTLEEQVGRVHENAARPSGMLTVPPGISKEGKARLLAQLESRNTGRLNAGKPLLMDHDSKWTPFQLSEEDLNTIAARRYQTLDIGRFFGVPAHLLFEAADTSSWGSGIEQLTLGFRMYTIEPEMQRIEAELNQKLIPKGSDYYVRFDRDALNALDQTVASQKLTAEINAGVTTINEARRALHRPVVEGGDTVLINATLQTLGRALAPPAPPPAIHSPEPKPGNDPETDDDADDSRGNDDGDNGADSEDSDVSGS